MAKSTPSRQHRHPTRITAVYAGFNAVRAVEIEINGETTRILKRGTAPLSADVWDSMPDTREALSLAIKSALSAGGITSSRVVTALPRRLVTLKFAHLPHAEPEMIRGMVQFEAQQYIPFPLEEVVLGYQILPDDSEDLTTVLIAAARRTLVEGVLSAFDKAGLEVTLLSVSSMALVQLAPPGALSLALLEVEPGEMDLAVVSDGKLQFARAVALPEIPEGQPHDQALAAEVARSLSAYQYEYRTRTVSAIRMAGVNPVSSDVEQGLQQLLELPVSALNGQLFPGADTQARAFATPIGIALESLLPDGINLIPETRAEKREAIRRKANMSALSVLVAALVFFSIGFINSQLRANKVEHAKAVRWNNSLSAAQSRIKVTREESDQTQKLWQTISGGSVKSVQAVDILKELSDSIPTKSGIYMTQMVVEHAGAITMHGNTLTETAATDLVTALQKNKLFYDVRLGYLGDITGDKEDRIAPISSAAPRRKGIGLPAPVGDISEPRPDTNMSFVITCRVRTAEALVDSGKANPTAQEVRK